HGFKNEQRPIALKAKIAGNGFPVQSETVDHSFATSAEIPKHFPIEVSLEVIGGDGATFPTLPSAALQQTVLLDCIGNGLETPIRGKLEHAALLFQAPALTRKVVRKILAPLFPVIFVFHFYRQAWRLDIFYCLPRCRNCID